MVPQVELLTFSKDVAVKKRFIMEEGIQLYSWNTLLSQLFS